MNTTTTTRQVYATIAKKSKANGGGATGADTVSHLQAIEELLGRLGHPLRALVTECDLCAALLLENFRSPLALKSHVKAVVAAMKLGALPMTPEAEARWVWPPPRARRSW